MREAYLDEIQYALGNYDSDVHAIAKTGHLVSSPEALLNAGFEQHHICKNTGVIDLARKCLNKFKTPLTDVDAIIYNTCLPINSNVGQVEEFKLDADVKHFMTFPASQLQHEYNMHNAQVIGITQMACTGVIAAMRMAKMLIRDDQRINKVLCITADRFPEEANYEQSYNLISDGAAACLISTAAIGFRVIQAHGITNGALLAADDDETVGSFFTYAHQVINETLERAGLTIDDIDWIVPQNTHKSAWGILAKILKLNTTRIANPSLADVGHVISGDNLINLKISNDNIKQGEYVLLFMAGYGLNWQCIILKKETAQ